MSYASCGNAVLAYDTGNDDRDVDLFMRPPDGYAQGIRRVIRRGGLIHGADAHQRTPVCFREQAARPDEDTGMGPARLLASVQAA